VRRVEFSPCRVWSRCPNPQLRMSGLLRRIMRVVRRGRLESQPLDTNLKKVDRGGLPRAACTNLTYSASKSRYMALMAAALWVPTVVCAWAPMLSRSKNQSLSLGALSPDQMITSSRLTVMPF
jgi:hypothetical protein